MTLMPDLPTAGRGLPLPALGAPGGPGPAPARERGEQVRPTEPAAVEESAAGRAETRRLMADRYALETQTRTAEGLRAALAETSRRVQPQVADVRELSARPRPSDEASARALEDARLAAADEVAQRTRVAAARLATLRITNQEKAARLAEEVRDDARRLADLNGELTADEPPTVERRAEIRQRQREIADGLAEKIGASIRENADGTVDAALDGRSLVDGSRVGQPVDVARPVSTGDRSRADSNADDTRVAPPPGREPPRPSREPEAREVPRPETRPPHEVEGTTPAGGAPPRIEGATVVRSVEPGARLVGGGVPEAAPPRARAGVDAGADTMTPHPGPPGEAGPLEPSGATGPPERTRGAGGPPEPDVDSPTAREVTGSPTTPGGDVDVTTPTRRPGPAPARPVPDAVKDVDDPAVPAPAPTDPTAPVAPAAAASARTHLSVRWADGSPVSVGGRLGGYVTADRTLLRPAVEALDEVARSIVGAVTDAQARGTTPAGDVGRPLLVGDSAWTIRLAEGLTGADIAWVTPVVGESAGSPRTPAGAEVEGSGPGGAPVDGTAVTDGAARPGSGGAPVSTLDALEAQTAATAAVLARRAGLAGAFDAAVTTASARLGRHVSEALGAIGEVSTSALVSALHQANAAMASAGTAAHQAVASGVPVLVGSSDPTVATASGAIPLTGTGAGRISETLTVDVRAVAASARAASGLGEPGPGTAAVGFGAAGAPVEETDGVTVGSAGVVGPRGGSRGEVGTATVATVSGVEIVTAGRVLAGVRPGIDVAVAGTGSATLAITPDPGPALGRVQALVDAVDKVAAAVGGDLGTAPSAPAAKGGFASAWSAMTAAATSFASSFDGQRTRDASAGESVAGVLGAVAVPLASAVGEAFVDADGRPLIPGTSVQRGRVALDREAFAREYVKDAVGVETVIASVARSVSATSDAASDPRVGVLAVRLQAELAPQGEYTIDKSGGEHRLDARRVELDRRAGALQSLLEHLEDQSTWLSGHTS